MSASNMYRRRSYLERYERGDCEEVWLELTALGPAIRQEPLYSDALAVARETMRRVRHNVELLVERLRTLEYRFACEHKGRSYPPLVLADAQSIVRLDAAEQMYGPLPFSVRMLYEVIEAVDFMGYQSHLEHLYPCWHWHPRCGRCTRDRPALHRFLRSDGRYR
jgi:hypothetical protein